MKLMSVRQSSFTYSGEHKSDPSFYHQGKWSGICFELLEALIKDMDVTYHVSEGLTYGAVNHSTGKWEGMIGALAYNECDMGIQSFTVSSQRMKVRSNVQRFITIYTK